MTKKNIDHIRQKYDDAIAIPYKTELENVRIEDF